jgi:hypothetical protein
VDIHSMLLMVLPMRGRSVSGIWSLSPWAGQEILAMRQNRSRSLHSFHRASTGACREFHRAGGKSQAGRRQGAGSERHFVALRPAFCDLPPDPGHPPNCSVSLFSSLFKSLSALRTVSILSTECMTVVWCLPPNWRPISGSEASVRCLARYMAICRG